MPELHLNQSALTYGDCGEILKELKNLEKR